MHLCSCSCCCCTVAHRQTNHKASYAENIVWTEAESFGFITSIWMQQMVERENIVWTEAESFGFPSCFLPLQLVSWFPFFQLPSKHRGQGVQDRWLLVLQGSLHAHFPFPSPMKLCSLVNRSLKFLHWRSILSTNLAKRNRMHWTLSSRKQLMQKRRWN